MSRRLIGIISAAMAFHIRIELKEPRSYEATPTRPNADTPTRFCLEVKVHGSQFLPIACAPGDERLGITIVSAPRFAY
jgi:hypothetical protein